MPRLFGRDLPAIIPSGVPGVQNPENLPEEVAAQMLVNDQRRIGKEEISKAIGILNDYKKGKESLKQRLLEDEKWYELQHWEVLRIKKDPKNDVPGDMPQPTSAWLFNSISNKHADAMDNYPEPIVLPRERSDEDSAKVLGSVLPVIMEHNSFEETYSLNWWEKLKHGTAAYGVFWNNDKENGLGDIDIRSVDLLKIFWEPGVQDIQKSRNLFIVELVDTDILNEQYPQFDGKLSGGSIDVAEYEYDKNIDTSDKSVVVDWYYKVKAPNGRTLLHYVKFCGNDLLYASQNDPRYKDRGWYDHGQYPIIVDTLFPEKGTPIGFGYIAISKDPQMYIDKLSAYVLETSMMATKKRFFMSRATNVNKEQFMNWNEPIVDVDGEISDVRLREIDTKGVDGNAINVIQMKIEEMKDTSSNRDVNSGGSASGVTAAAAIAALQEAGNKASRDMIAASYRSYTKLVSMVIELIRQFYDEKRCFRITGDMPGQYEFVDMDNSQLKDQPMPSASGHDFVRRPVFDLKVKAQKKNPFSRMEQNERAKELYSMGFFNPDKAQEAMLALEMMDFEGIEKIKEQVNQGATLLNMYKQQQEQLNQALQLISQMTGQPAPGVPSGGSTGSPVPSGGSTLAEGVTAAQTPMTSYGQRLAARSTPSLDATNAATNPGGR